MYTYSTCTCTHVLLTCHEATISPILGVKSDKLLAITVGGLGVTTVVVVVVEEEEEEEQEEDEGVMKTVVVGQTHTDGDMSQTIADDIKMEELVEDGEDVLLLVLVLVLVLLVVLVVEVWTIEKERERERKIHVDREKKKDRKREREIER